MLAAFLPWPCSAFAQQAEPPAGLRTAGGSVAFSGLVQIWHTAASEPSLDTFRVRRAELKLTGDIATGKARWTVMIDPAKALGVNRDDDDVVVNQASRILQDVYVTLGSTRFGLDAGQFKLPLGWEGRQSSAMLDVVERALFASDRARGGTYSDVRDVGVMVHSSPHAALDLAVGLFNGSGDTQNAADSNVSKAVYGRVSIRPGIGALQFGVSGGGEPSAAPRQRILADVEWAYRAFTLRAEVATGRDGPTRRLGYYAHVGWRVTSEVDAVARFDTWDPDRRDAASPSGAAERDVVVGANWWLSPRTLKLQATILRKTFTGPPLSSRWVWLTNLQAAW